jgi:hypothetical protein
MTDLDMEMMGKMKRRMDGQSYWMVIVTVRIMRGILLRPGTGAIAFCVFCVIFGPFVAFSVLRKNGKINAKKTQKLDDF